MITTKQLTKFTPHSQCGAIDEDDIEIIIMCVCAVAFALVCRVCYMYFKVKISDGSEEFLNAIDSAEHGLAIDHLEDEIGYWAQASGDSEDKEPEALYTPVRGVAKLRTEAIEVVHHRRIRRGKRVPYIACVVAECKVKFGTPVDNAANHLAVQRFAANIMAKHGVRPSHVREVLPMVVVCTFIPSQYEREAAALANSIAAIHYKGGGSNGLIPKWAYGSIRGDEGC